MVWIDGLRVAAMRDARRLGKVKVKPPRGQSPGPWRERMSRGKT
jgi:hypothetical protein